MSVDLTVLGRNIERLQHELREVHAEQSSLRAEFAGLRAHFAAHVSALHVALDAKLEARLADFGRSIDVRFEMTHAQMATNLEVLLAADKRIEGRIDALQGQMDERFEAMHRQMAANQDVLLKEIRGLSQG